MNKLSSQIGSELNVQLWFSCSRCCVTVYICVDNLAMGGKLKFKYGRMCLLDNDFLIL